MKANKKPFLPPLLSLDFYLSNYLDLANKLKAESDLRNVVKVLGKLMNTDVQSIIEEDNYDALIITDARLKIVWVNEGFSEMTGYSKKFALGKRPDFLQGAETSEATKRKIRHHLNNQEGFKTSILNYRRNGETYLCEIKAVPIFNENREIVNYLAVERELRAA